MGGAELFFLDDHIDGQVELVQEPCNLFPAVPDNDDNVPDAVCYERIDRVRDDGAVCHRDHRFWPAPRERADPFSLSCRKNNCLHAFTYRIAEFSPKLPSI